jgi:hypothetical protein
MVDTLLNKCSAGMKPVYSEKDAFQNFRNDI